MRYLLFSLLFLSACASDNIRACGNSCQGFMKSYNLAKGECVCMSVKEMCGEKNED